MTIYSPDTMRSMLPPGSIATVNRWLTRGDGIAIYQNVDLGSFSVGHRKFVSFGSTAAQLETETPPTTLPDIGNQIGWRYELQGVYRGGVL